MMGSAGGFFEIWAWMASLGFLAMLQQFIPREYTDWFWRYIHKYLRGMTSYIFCEVPEYDNGTSNKLYQDVKQYLSSRSIEGAYRVNMCKSKQQRAATFSMSNGEEVNDTFEGVSVYWMHTTEYRNGSQMFGYYGGMEDEKRKFTLRLKKKDKERILDAYTAHIESLARELEREARDLLLHTNSKGQDPYSRRKIWDSVTFMHPANFDTLALDGDMKTRILKDLEKFAASEDFYKKVGKAWKRGYLLYGPPGTGKSSMIAAIANKMRYDIYDLELAEVETNSQLRKMLLQTSSKSIIVIEDIDCSLDLSGQRKKTKEKEAAPVPGAPPKPKDNRQSEVTLSGLLNFVDGLWSCCGSERIFIFTTNYKEKLDPALLRAGRMDMHIHLNYCTFSAFQTLSQNYLQLTDHEMFEDVERAFEGTYMTPAEVGEVLIRNLDDSPDVVLQRLIEELGEHREDPRLKALEEEKAAEEAALAEEKAAEEKAAEEKAAEEKAAEEKGEDKKAEDEKVAKEEDGKLKKGNQKVSEEKEEEDEDAEAEEGRQKASNSVEQTMSKERDEVVKSKSNVDAGQKETSDDGDQKEFAKAIRISGEKIVPVDDTDFGPDQKSLTTKPVEDVVSTVPSSQV